MRPSRKGQVPEPGVWLEAPLRAILQDQGDEARGVPEWRRAGASAVTAEAREEGYRMDDLRKENGFHRGAERPLLRAGAFGGIALLLAIPMASCRSMDPEPAGALGRDAADSGMVGAREAAPPISERKSAPPAPALARHLAFARSAISGERARRLVGFMDPSYRVPGNAPFNAALQRVVEELEAVGYVEESRAAGDPALSSSLTYRMEERPLTDPTWEPVRAALSIAGAPDPLMTLETNINLMAANSYSTPPGGVEGEVVYVGAGTEEDFSGKDVEGKVVMGDAHPRVLFSRAVQERGALGILAFRLSSFNRPDVNRDIAPMQSIPLDSVARSWGLLLSGNARSALLDAMEEGPVRVAVEAETRVYPSTELTLVAEVRGTVEPEERFVFSAHVQESGANDNATGVAAQAEIARALAQGVGEGVFQPHRTITMIWGDEIRSTRRYLEDDPTRAQGVIWGMSLDMVGEDTEKTGGTFLIEKMPDPSAVWTRGEDQHTEWGGRPLSLEDMTPHYLNDVVLHRCLEQAAGSDWEVRTNPFEGGSDHVPFLRSGAAGILLWHFTDQFYHTDGDRLEMVSAETLENVGVCAAVSAMTLVSADSGTAVFLVGEVRDAALGRLARESALSQEALEAGGDPEEEREILAAWTDWYLEALSAMEDLEADGPSVPVVRAIQEAREQVGSTGRYYRGLIPEKTEG